MPEKKQPEAPAIHLNEIKKNTASNNPCPSNLSSFQINPNNQIEKQLLKILAATITCARTNKLESPH
jgi:hypothetical protein